MHFIHAPSGHRRLAEIGVALAAVVALLAGTVAVAAASVSTDAYYYNAGDTVQITGDQMSPGENVTVDVNPPDGSLSQEHVVVADANGDFTDSYTLAADAPAGIYTVVATGQSSGSVFTTTFDPAANNCMDDVTPTADTPTLNSITVHWVATCTQEDGFRVKYGTAHNGPYGTTVTTGADASSKILTGLTCGTTYYFVVQAYKTDGPGEQNSTSHEGSLSTAVCGSGPTADAGADTSGDEGSAIALDGSASTGTGTLSYAWSADATGLDSPGNANGPGPECTFDDATSSTPNMTCNDDSGAGTVTVTLIVTDDNSSDSDTVEVTVDNVDPVVAAPADWTVTPTNCSVDVTAGFTDAGLNDTHTATIEWGDTHSSNGTVTEESNTTDGGSVTGSHTYDGPNVYNIKVTVTDDDGGSGDATYTGFDNSPAVTQPIPPIMAGKTFKVGSTIPVKVVVTGCTSGLTPQIQVAPASVVPIKSSGKSNLDDYLRYTADLPGFIYNWSTKGWTTNTTYTITITGLPGSVEITQPVTLVK